MKVRIEKQEQPNFKPIVLQITIQNKEELKKFHEFFGDTVSSDDISQTIYRDLKNDYNL